jgi:hypothetical protein
MSFSVSEFVLSFSHDSFFFTEILFEPVSRITLKKITSKTVLLRFHDNRKVNVECINEISEPKAKKVLKSVLEAQNYEKVCKIISEAEKVCKSVLEAKEL